MRRAAPWVACALGIVLLALLLPAFDPAQPDGYSITRAQAEAIADRQARRLGIPVDQAWKTVIWEEAGVLEKEFARDPARRSAANLDPVVGPRLSWFTVTYFRRGLEKRPEHGTVTVARDGRILGARKRARAEEPGAKPDGASLRQRADAFVRSTSLAGAPNPKFEDVRPTIQTGRIDHTFRYSVPTSFDTGAVGLYLHVYFIGDQFAGWNVIEEYRDGTQFRGEFGEGLVEVLIQYGVLFTLLLVLLVIYLRKYHAGEVGVGAGAFLFATALVLHILGITMSAAEQSVYSQFGGVEALHTAIALGGFQFLFYSIPMAVLVFLAWSVGESYARERWGEKLASFDAVIKREKLNATVGRAVLIGLLAAPALAAAALLPAWIGVKTGFVYPTSGPYTRNILFTSGGSFTVLTNAMVDAIGVTVLTFVLALAHRKRVLWLGILAALIIGTLLGAAETPVAPQIRQLLLGFGGVAACVAVFLASDLLAAAIALFAGTLILSFVPFLRAVQGDATTTPFLLLVIPFAALLAYAVAGLMSRRQVTYKYEDLAPHVRRIVERERVKAEIDAANRIQAALLPTEGPEISGASVASHYRSATEIGGDYFDFLPLPTGEIGLAFGDVAGHGLTSGIVMAMAKSALLVQIGYDSSPKRVMEVLNDTVIKTAPRRMMMTFFFGVLDPLAQQLRFSSAGHLDPYVFRAKEGTVRPLSAWGFPLGVRRRDPFKEITVQFEPGDRLILYSDGLIEAVDDDGEPFGFARFEKVLRDTGVQSANDIKRAILDSVKRFTRNRPPEDDQTLVVVSFKEIESVGLFREEAVAVVAGSALPN
jgi:hypothetical protein